MTELERQLTAALERLSAQCEMEQRRHSEQVEALQQRVEQQAAQSETLRRASRAALRANGTLGRGLQDARRDVARALDLMRQRGRERDYGPSR